MNQHILLTIAAALGGSATLSNGALFVPDAPHVPDALRQLSTRFPIHHEQLAPGWPHIVSIAPVEGALIAAWDDDDPGLRVGAL